jgi:uncharacterized damage-inducible protein DinB
MWEELADGLPDEAFAAELSVPSNSIGQQFWCLVGARESYSRAIAAGGWQGFACSMNAEDIAGRVGILRGLTDSAEMFALVAANADWDEARTNLLLELLEHESQHMGQLIRYCYGLGYSFPDSWKKRWALS